MGNILHLKRVTSPPQSVCDDLLNHDTYFALIVQYLPLKCIFSRVVLLSKYHLHFFNHHSHKNIIKRLISNEIGQIFKISDSFKEHFMNHDTNVYKLIPKFYSDFGSIQKIAFPKYHTRMMDYYSKWIKDEEKYGFHYDDASDEDESDDDYENPFHNQYNAIKYEKIPFDFAMISKLHQSELIIHWLQFIINQSVIDCEHLDCVYLNDHTSDEYHWTETQSIIGICSINNPNKTEGGICFFSILLRKICHLPSDEFAVVIKFILDHSLYVHVQSFICVNLKYFCAVKDKRIGCDNYRIYLDECIRHKSFEGKKSEIIRRINQRWPKFNLYKTVWSTICTGNKTEECVWNEAVMNEYYNDMFGRVGDFLRKYVNETELFPYLHATKETELPTESNIKFDEYNQLFLSLLGFVNSS